MTSSSVLLLFCLAIGCCIAAIPPLTVVEHALTDKVIKFGPDTDNTGDELVFANPIFDATNETQIASDQGFCIRTVVGEAWECHWTNFLPGGQVSVQGPFFDSSDSVMVITGGTGKFMGIQGYMNLNHRDNPAEYQFVFNFL